MTRPPLPLLTILRFFAALEVVIFHFFYFQQTDVLHSVLSGGRQAVTFFFVLSGFILTYVYGGPAGKRDPAISARSFWRARFARIIPAYIAGLLLGLPFFAYSALVSHMTSIADFVQGLILVPLLLQAWWPPAALAWNPPAWSLSVEMLFYALFPVLAKISSRIPSNIFLAVALGMVLADAVVVQSIMPGPDFTAKDWFPILYDPLFHLPQFVLGMATGRLYLTGKAPLLRENFALFAAAALLAAATIGARAFLPWWASSNAVLAPLFGVMIFCGARSALGRGQGWIAAILVFLGEASYAVYILHSPLLAWWAWIEKKLDIVLPLSLAFVPYLCLLLALSGMVFLYVEKPMRRVILGHPSHRDA